MTTSATLDWPQADAEKTAQRGPARRSTPSALMTICLLAIAALLLALAWPVLIGHVYLADDLGEFHLPLRAFYADQLARGESFDWCPDLYCGFYLTGEGQVGAYHPLHLLLYRSLPLPLAFGLECVLSYPLMLAGMYLLLRRWQLNRDAALLGAMTFAFGGFNLLHFVHPNAVAVVAHLPWILLAIDVMVRSASPLHRRLAWASVALLTGSQLLLGYPQYALLSLSVELAYVAWLCPVAAASPLSTIGRWLAAGVVGLTLGSVQLLPTLDALQSSARSDTSSGFATLGSLHPLNIVQLVAPYLFTTRVVGQNTHELGLYSGSVTLALAAFALLASHRSSARRLALAALGLALLALLWSFGQFGPFAWLQTNLPLINTIRFPSRTIVVVQFAIAVLAAIGFALLLQRDSEPRSPRALWILPAASIAITAWAVLQWREFIAPWPLVIAGPLLITAATLLTSLAIRGARWAAACLVLLAAADLGAYGLSYSIVGRTLPYSQFVQSIDAPPGSPTGRVALDLIAGSQAAPMPAGQRRGDAILLKGFECVDGYAGLEPARRLDYRQPAALRAAGTHWISPHSIQQLSPASARDLTPDPAAAAHWILLSGARPRAWLVTKTRLTTNPATDISRISLADEALVDERVSLPPAIPGHVEVVSDRPGQILLQTHSFTPQLLIVNESRHPGWLATIDDRPVPLLAANGDFLGLVIPAGRHEISLDFSPTSLRWGRIASCFGLGLIVAACVSGAHRRRRSPPDKPTYE